jgi:hypothetical protein
MPTIRQLSGVVSGLSARRTGPAFAEQRWVTVSYASRRRPGRLVPFRPVAIFGRCGRRGVVHLACAGLAGLCLPSAVEWPGDA